MADTNPEEFTAVLGSVRISRINCLIGTHMCLFHCMTIDVRYSNIHSGSILSYHTAKRAFPSCLISNHPDRWPLGPKAYQGIIVIHFDQNYSPVMMFLDQTKRKRSQFSDFATNMVFLGGKSKIEEKELISLKAYREIVKSFSESMQYEQYFSSFF